MGGADKGGILVRDGPSTTSKQLPGCRGAGLGKLSPNPTRVWDPPCKLSQARGATLDGLPRLGGRCLDRARRSMHLASGVEELGRNGDRVNYRLISGSGPETGWATLQQKKRSRGMASGELSSKDLGSQGEHQPQGQRVAQKGRGLENKIRGLYRNPCVGTCGTPNFGVFEKQNFWELLGFGRAY